MNTFICNIFERFSFLDGPLPLSGCLVYCLAGVISTVVPDSPHKIFIGGLPNYLNEDQVSLCCLVSIASCNRFEPLSGNTMQLDSDLDFNTEPLQNSNFE
jgi:hypothetical protein